MHFDSIGATKRCDPWLVPLIYNTLPIQHHLVTAVYSYWSFLSSISNLDIWLMDFHFIPTSAFYVVTHVQFPLSYLTSSSLFPFPPDTCSQVTTWTLQSLKTPWLQAWIPVLGTVVDQISKSIELRPYSLWGPSIWIHYPEVTSILTHKKLFLLGVKSTCFVPSSVQAPERGKSWCDILWFCICLVHFY